MSDLSHAQVDELISKVAGTDIANTFALKVAVALALQNLRTFTPPINVATFTPDLQPANGSLQVIAGTAAAFTIANPINVPAGDISGFVLVLAIVNGTAGALGAITAGSQYKLAGAAFPTPAAGNRRFVYLVNMGTQAAPLWYEITRSAADIPN